MSVEHAYGWLSLIPPLIAITLAITTKEVYSSLILGVLSGYIIYVNFAPAEIWSTLAVKSRIMGPISETINSMLNAAGTRENLSLLFFLSILGGLVAILTCAGGSRAFARWASNKIKTKRGAQMSTFALGVVIFIDDYFNALTVGSVMGPITDRYNISRAKLAYIIDATAAPVTVLFPVSSWVATVISMIDPTLRQCGYETQGLAAFLASVPYNFYAWLTLFMVVLVSLTGADFGLMKKFEDQAREHGTESVNVDESMRGDLASLKISDKASVWDLISSIVVLVALAIISMIYTGGFFEGGMTFAEALGNCDSSLALVYAGIGTVLFSLVLFVPRGLLSIRQFLDAFIQGMKMMVGPVLLLILAWTMGNVLGEGCLNTGNYVAELARGALPGWLLPVMIFVLSAFIAFTTGVSWGTMAIMLPTSIAVCTAVDPSYIFAVIGATLAGSVFGDHCSPLADTTIMSSAGAGCIHLDHVMSQLPYALLTAGACVIGYVIVGLTDNWPVALLLCAAMLFAVMMFIKRRNLKNEQ